MIAKVSGNLALVGLSWWSRTMVGFDRWGRKMVAVLQNARDDLHDVLAGEPNASAQRRDHSPIRGSTGTLTVCAPTAFTMSRRARRSLRNPLLSSGHAVVRSAWVTQ